MGFATIVIGIIGLIFRIWTSEFRLKEYLGEKRGHTSRFITYYFFISMILDLQFNVFLLISLLSSPAMVMSFFIFDIPYFKNDFQNEARKDRWIIFLERLTLHLPSSIFALYYYGFSNSPVGFFVLMFTLLNFIIGLLAVLLPMFIFDPRVKYKKEWPRGPIVVTGFCLSVVGSVVFYYLLLLKHNLHDNFLSLF